MVKQCIETMNSNNVEGIEQDLIDRALEMIEEA